MTEIRRNKKLPIQAKTLYTKELFPFPINWDEEIVPLPLDAIADEINILTDIYSHLFTNEDKETLGVICQISYSNCEKTDKRVLTTGRHRLSMLDVSPIFVALDTDPSRGNEPEKNMYSIERFVRLLILQHILGNITLNGELLYNACQFTKTFRYKGRHEDDKDVGWDSISYRRLQEKFIPYLEEDNWKGLDFSVKEHYDKLNKLTKSGRVNEQTLYEIGFKHLSSLTAIAAGRIIPSSQKKRRNYELRRQIIEPKLTNTKESLNTNKFIDDGENTTPVTILSSPFLDESDDIGVSDVHDTLNDSAVKSLAIRGSFLRLSSLLGGCSAEALYPAEANKCMEWLLSYQPRSESEHLARLFWVLCGCTMQRFDNLVAAAGVHITNIPRPKIKIKVAEDTINIRFEVLNSSNFEQVNKEISELYAEVDSEVYYNLQLPVLEEALGMLKNLSGKEESDSFVQDILASKRMIRSLIRKHVCYKFTENMLRGGFLQELFQTSKDLPFCQIISHDELGMSHAALNYIATDTNNIQEIVNKTVNGLYPELHQDFRISSNPKKIGAPTSAINIDVIRQSVRKLEQSTKWPFNSRQVSLGELINEHERLTDHVAWLLMLVTANRNLSDFSEITLDQFSFSANLIVFQDKGSDPSIFRRIAAINDYVVGEILRLYDLTTVLIDRFRRRSSNSNYKNACQDLKSRVQGNKPLFCRIEVQDDKYSISPWFGRTFIRELIHEKINPDLARHFFSTHMRSKKILSPILIETQIGHSCGYSFFSDTSVISPLEFSQALQEPLNNYLSDLGYKTTNVYKLPAGKKYEVNDNDGWKDIDANILKIKKDDADRIKSMVIKSLSKIELNTDNKNTTLKKLCDKIIREHLDISDDQTFPKKLNLTEIDAKKIYSKLIGTINTASAIGLISAATTLRKRIKQLASNYNWTIKLPPPLFWNINEPIPFTKYHLNAYENILAFRKDIALKWAFNDEKENKEGLYALTILAFGGPMKINALYQISKNHSSIVTSPKNDAIFVDIFDPAHQSITLSGLPMTALLSWDKNGISNLSEVQLKKLIYQAIPEKWKSENLIKTLKNIESLIKIGRSIELPPLLFGTETYATPSRNLTSERLSDLLSNRISANNYNIENSVSTINILKPLTKEKRKKKNVSEKISIKKEYQLLLESIDHPRLYNVKSTVNGLKPRTPNKCSSISIFNYLEKYHPHPCIQLVAHWARVLLGPSSNLRDGKELAKSTIKSYITSLNKIFSRCLAKNNIYDFDDEELKCIIEAELEKHEKGYDDYVYVLNRFFYDMSESLRIQELIFRYKDDNSRTIEAIRAVIITPAEAEFSRQILHDWSKNDGVSVRTHLSLQDAIEYLSFTEKIGTRRSELQYSKNKNINILQGTAILDVRPNRKRGLKTHASKRSIVIDELSNNIKINNCYNTKNNTYIFNNFNKLKNPIKILHQSLKFATGDHTARGHDCRHTLPSKKIIEVFSHSDIINRITFMSKITSNLGHASPLTTISCYVHTNSYISSIFYSLGVTSIKEKEVLAISNEAILHSRQMFNYSKNNSISENSQILKSFTQNRKTIAVIKKTLPSAPKSLIKEDVKLSDAVIFLMNASCKKEPWDIYAPEIKQVNLQKLIECFSISQRELKIEYISSEKIDRIKSMSIGKNGFFERSQIDQEQVKAWALTLQTLSSKHQFISAYNALKNSAEISINRRGTEITINTNSIKSTDNIHNAILELKSPLLLSYKNKKQLSISIKNTEKQISRSSIKFYILAVHSVGMYFINN